MFLVREVLSCKPGKVGELREKFASLGAVLSGRREIFKVEG